MADLTKTQTTTHRKKKDRSAAGPPPCKEVFERWEQHVGKRMNAEGADTVAVPEIYGKHAVGTVEKNVCARCRSGQEFTNDAETRFVPVRQSPNVVGIRRFGNADMLDHAGRHDAAKGAAPKGEIPRVGKNKRRASRMLLNPTREAVGVDVYADDADAQPAPFGDGVAVTTPNVEQAECSANRGIGDEGTIELDTLGRRRLLKALSLSQKMIHAVWECGA